MRADFSLAVTGFFITMRALSYFAAFCVLTLPALAYAGQPRFLEAYGDWDTYVYSENGAKVCYMASRPQKDEGKYTQRGEIYAYITHRPAEGSRDVFGYVAGYQYQPGSEVSVDFGGDKVTLFTQDDKAWALDDKSDSKLAKLVKAKSKMTVRGTSSRGTKTKDTFSLHGSTNAYNRISKECGLK